MFTGIVLTLLPILWVLVVYRPSRGLRLYPEQQSARRFRLIYGLKLLSRWNDLRDRELVVEPCSVYSMEAKDGRTKTAIALTGIFHATGIIGTLLSLGASNELVEKQAIAFMIKVKGADQPLAIFLTRDSAQELIEMYCAACKNKLDGYRSAPNRFEKRPGA